MKIEITKRQYDLIREALEPFYYRCKEEGDTKKKYEVEELEILLIKHARETE